MIRRCLDALTWADEVVIVDSFSADETPQITQSYPNVTFHQWVRPGIYSIYAKVNYGIDRARGDWIMRLDSDEVVSPELAQEIQEVLALDEVPYDGYWIPSRTYFFGKWIRYGIAYNTEGINKTNPGHGYRKCLWRRGMARYADHHIHEELETKGNWGYLMHPYDHFSHATVSQWIAKMNFYTDIDVARWSFDDPMYKRYHPLKTLVATWLRFYDHYVKRKGYKDGMHGFMLAGLNAVYVFVERCKMWERLWKEEQGQGSAQHPS
jgi:glycosyltransferase involved in cell wall biosynthesis